MSSSVTLPFSDINPSQTASKAATYIPPLQVTTTGPPGSVPQTQPTASFISHNPNPTTPAIINDLQWIEQYLDIHQMSFPSYRYAYFLWFCIVLFVLLFGIAHWTGTKGGWLGAKWNKWALRRRTWRKKHAVAAAMKAPNRHKQPSALPSNAQLLSVLFLCIGPLILCALGPDYIAPGTHLWDLSHNLTRRDFHISYYILPRAPPTASTATTRPPDYSIPKAWWTAGGRTGIIAFSLFPLAILLSLKAPPFALFALPYLTQIHFDKLARLHRWCGRLIWLIAAIHVATWSVQLARDPRKGSIRTDTFAIDYALLYDKFVYAIIAFSCLTLLTILSLSPIREAHYELFYYMHIFLIVATLVFSALHYPPLWWWCWSALLLWIAERSWRYGRFLLVNGILFSRQHNTPKSGDTWELDVRASNASRNHISPISPEKPQPIRMPSGAVDPFAEYVPELFTPHDADDKRPWSASDDSSPLRSAVPFSPSTATFQVHQSRPSHPTSIHSPAERLPPSGFAYAQVMAGKTVRLTLLTSRPVTWAPGQHVLLTVPAVSKFTSHPFTIASVSDERHPAGLGREMVLLVRARRGFTFRLWEEVVRRSTNTGKSAGPSSHPTNGVILRAYIDGPFGSSIRARWGAHSSVVIIAGGSGVSFAISILEYLCLGMSGRDVTSLGTKGGGLGRSTFLTERVRFVWLVREYSHLQWCASALRRCMEMVPNFNLQVDLFVTNPSNGVSGPVPAPFNSQSPYDDLVPPTPRFAKGRMSRTSSMESLDSNFSTSSLVDLNYADPNATPQTNELGHEEHILDFTNFDGEDDTRAPGEAQLSTRLRKEGRLRRAKSRKAAGAAQAKSQLNQRATEPSHTPSPSDYSVTLHPPRMSGLGASHPSLDTFSFPRTSTERGPPSGQLSPHPQRGSALPPGSSLYGDQPWNQPPASFKDRERWSSARFSSAESTYSHDGNMDRRSLGGAESVRALLNDEDVSYIQINDEEADDLNVISELARTGRPKLDRILADEVERSRGAVAVACCGPTSLNAVVRKLVAAQIDPGRVRKGDIRGTVTLVNEDYEW